jgi:hypothetical protein
VFRSSIVVGVERPSPPDRGFTHSGCQASTALRPAAFGVLGVGLFGNAALSGW